MPIAFNPPPLPTPDRALAAPPDKNDDGANASADPFSAVLSAATGALAGEARTRAGKVLSERGDAERTDRANAAAARDEDDTATTSATALAAALQALLPAQAPPAPAGDAPTLAGGASDPRTAGRSGTTTAAGVRGERGSAAPTILDDARASAVAAHPGPPAAAIVVQEPAHRNGTDDDTAARSDARSRLAAMQDDALRMEAVAPRTTSAPTALAADMLALAATRGDKDDATRQVGAEALQLPDGSPLPSDVAAPRAPAIPSVVIESPAFSATWRAEVAQEIAQFVMLRHDRAELHITPPHLGPISVQVTMDAGQANLLVTAPQPATRDALELALPQLRDSLAQQGITLGQASVQDDRPRPFSAPADRHGGSGSAESSDAAVRAGSTTPAVVARVRGLIDLFA